MIWDVVCPMKCYECIRLALHLKLEIICTQQGSIWLWHALCVVCSNREKQYKNVQQRAMVLKRIGRKLSYFFILGEGPEGWWCKRRLMMEEDVDDGRGGWWWKRRLMMEEEVEVELESEWEEKAMLNWNFNVDWWIRRSVMSWIDKGRKDTTAVEVYYPIIL